MVSLSRLIAAALALVALPAAAADDRGVNPCDFTGFDKPCKVANGEYRAFKPYGDGPHPAVVYLYGSTGRADHRYRDEHFRDAITGRGYVLIVPEALPVVRYLGGVTDTGWSRAARRDEHPRDDIAFIEAVLDHAQDRFRIDRRRVIFLGQSDGGYLLWEIACHHPRMAAAYAVHAGTYGAPRPPRRCEAPVRFVQTHGRRDRIVAFEDQDRHPVTGVPYGANPLEALDTLARTNGCRPRAEAERSRIAGFRRTEWRGCRQGAKLDYLVHGGGHGWPKTWVPTVLDWFEAFDLGPAPVGERHVRQVGTRGAEGDSRFKTISSGSRFERAPK
ncbi:MAG: alpha/beta hydrolase family esterase [Paracoccaceae bacterium]